ncbi:MAG TPA: GTP-binding protein [Clostridia bacterium]|nr:GTP-binding protein [Clostridia bacterium]
MDICKKSLTPEDNALQHNALELKEMNIVIVGHVDHGKSTVIGRLLADTGSLPQGKLEMIRELCRRTSKPFEYAFLLDALKDERAQGITIDVARSFFKTEKRKYIIIDAPGHIEFLKNMITGASRAEAALLVIDAHEGIQENSRRHGYMLSMLGIKQVAVLINKLDLIAENERESVYKNITTEYGAFLQEIELEPSCFIPISATKGYNIAEETGNMGWYTGPTVLEALDNFTEVLPLNDLPFRMWVQDVYKFTAQNDQRRIIAGTVSSGQLTVGDEIIFSPSGKKTFVKSIEVFNEEPKSSVGTGYATGFCMTEQIYAKRGELISIIGQDSPLTGSRFKASVFWLGKEPLAPDKNYKIKIGSAQVGCRLDAVVGVLNAATLEGVDRSFVERHEVAQCIFRLDRPLAFDRAGQFEETVRFVIVDEYEIAGGGIITDLADDTELGKNLMRRDIKWLKSSVTRTERETYYKQKAQLVLLTGKTQTDKKTIAGKLETKLLESGKIAYYLGIGNLLYGVDADIKTNDSLNTPEERQEHIRRLGEVANLMLDAGNILIVTASELDSGELDALRQIITTDHILTVWVGPAINRIRDFDLSFDDKDTDIANELFDALIQAQSD